MLHETIALERKQGTQSSMVVVHVSFSSKPRISRESKDILPFFFPILLAFLEVDVSLLPLLLKDSCFQLYTMVPVT